MPRYFLFFILPCLFFTTTFATDYAIGVNYITMQDGLSDNNVNAIIKDSKGFIWLGTSDGLNRYDGYEIKSFFLQGGSLNISCLYQCPSGYIWIGTTDGLHIFNPRSESFISYAEGNSKIPSLEVSGIAGDISNGILITTRLGLACLNFDNDKPDLNTARITWRNKANSPGLDYDGLSGIIKERDGIYWLGTTTNQIARYDFKNHTFKSFLLPKPESPDALFIVTKLSFIQNQLIISTLGNGLFLFNPATYKITSITHQNGCNASISHPDVYGVERDMQGDYWIATWDGLDQLPQLDDLPGIKHYNWDHPLLGDKFENRIISMLYDPSGVIWTGTHGGGAVKIDIAKQFYSNYRFNSLYEVQDFSIDTNNDLFISLYHGGIKKTRLPLDNTAIFDRFSTIYKSKRHIPSDIILSSVTDKAGNSWFGTIESSLLKYSPGNDEIQEFKITVDNKPGWQGRIEALYIDSKGRFWIGTTNGLLQYKRTAHTFHLSQPTNKLKEDLTGRHIRTILEDSRGNIWLGTNSGLNKIVYHAFDSLYFKSFNDFNISPHILDNKEVWALYEMPGERLWIGYRGGLGYLNAGDDTIRFLNKRDGLCHNFVTCLTGFGDSTLWIGTNSGLSKYDIKAGRFSNYYIANNIRAVNKFDSGHLLWGNNKGLLYFHPDSIRKNTFHSPAVITNIRIQNRAVKVNELWSGRPILTQAAPYTKAITLHHPHNSFAIDYVGLSYLHQQANKYAYRLVNYNAEWTEVDGTQRTVSYNNLPAGTYTFEIKASNNDGAWSPEITALSICIKPPWYASWWGRLLIVLALMVVLYILYKLRIRQVYREQQLINQGNELKHKLAIEKIKREKEHDVADMKSRFFTNISHELRTPLTLITAPLKDILNDSHVPQSILHKLKLVNQHAQQLYRLISQLLDLRKTETGSMPLKASKNNVAAFVKNITRSFDLYAETQAVKLHMASDKANIQLWFDTEKLRIVLSNLISNAIKFSSKNDIVTITIKEIKEWCEISIKDNGPGIEPGEQEMVFERFYQGKASHNIQQAGTGIGLSLAREFIYLHKGMLTVDSLPGKGAAFIIKLPLGNTHLSQADKYDSGSAVPPALKAMEAFTPSAPPVTAATAKLPSLLIVEDHAELRRYIRSVLDKDFNIYEATNGEEALHLLNETIPQLVLSDVMMPVMDGITLCKIIKTKKQYCHIPFILLTAKSKDQDIVSGIETGADDYITKPFTPAILKAKVKHLIKSRALLKSYYSNKITLSPNSVEVEPKEEQFIREAILFVEDNLTNPQFNAQLLAGHLHMSQATLYRRIKTITGDNISVFIRSIRLKKAAQLLLSKAYTVAEVADKIGFNDVAYFRKCFIKQFGVNPSKYKV